MIKNPSHWPITETRLVTKWTYVNQDGGKYVYEKLEQGSVYCIKYLHDYIHSDTPHTHLGDIPQAYILQWPHRFNFSYF